MFKENIFYNIKQKKNLFEKQPYDNESTIESSRGLKVKASFTNYKNLTMAMKNDCLIFYEDENCFQSNSPGFVYYIIKYQTKIRTTLYKILNFAGDSFMIIEVNRNDESEFRSLFKNHFVFTDFEEKYRSQELIFGVKTFSKTVLFESVNPEKYACKKFFVESYDKKEALELKITQQIYNSITNLKALDYFNFNFVNFYETNDQFVIIFENQDSVSIEEFMEVFAKIDQDSFLFKCLFSDILKFIHKIDNLNFFAPFLNSKNMIICLNTNHKKQASKKKSTLKQPVELNFFDESKENVTSKLLKQISNIMRIYSDGNRMNDDLIENDVLLEDIQSLISIKYLNSTLLFQKEIDTSFEKKNSCKVGLNTAVLCSNYIQFFNKNTNLNICGILMIFLLTKENLFWRFEDFINKQKHSHFLSFPIQKISKLHPQERSLIVEAFSQIDSGEFVKLFSVYIDLFKLKSKQPEDDSQESYEMITSQSEIEGRVESHKKVESTSHFSDKSKSGANINESQLLSQKMTINDKSEKDVSEKNKNISRNFCDSESSEGEEESLDSKMIKLSNLSAVLFKKTAIK